MTRDKAIREAVKRWGKRALIRANERISSPERREVAQAAFTQAKDRITAIDAEIDERLAALDWLQALKAERRELVDRKRRDAYDMTYYKFNVGSTDRILGAFWIAGSGDTWELAFADADTKTKGGASSARLDTSTDSEVK